jgi:hypothetical protein
VTLQRLIFKGIVGPGPRVLRALCRKALVIARAGLIVMLFLPRALLAASDCASAFGEFGVRYFPFVKARSTALQVKVDELNWLRSRPVAAYASERGRALLPSGRELPNEAPSLFLRDQMQQDLWRIFELRSELEALPLLEFRPWWREYRDALLLLHPNVVGSARGGLNLGDLNQSIWTTYLLSHAQAKNRNWIQKQLEHMHPRYWAHWSWVLTRGGTRWALRNTQTLLIVGPLATIFGSWIWIVVGPTARFAEQDGAERFKELASQVNTWLNSKGAVLDQARELELLTDELQRFEFEGLKPEQALKEWQEFEESYYDIFSRFSRTLPAHLRDGRSLYRELVLMAPLTLASQLATFDIQYWTHRAALEKLEAEPAPRAELVQIHKERMDAAESSMAAVLAAWKLTEFLYPEVAREKSNQSARNSLQDGFLKFSNQLRFEVYQRQYIEQVRTFLREVQLDLKLTESAAQSLNSDPKLASPHLAPTSRPSMGVEETRSPNSIPQAALPGDLVWLWRGRYQSLSWQDLDTF